MSFYSLCICESCPFLLLILLLPERNYYSLRVTRELTVKFNSYAALLSTNFLPGGADPAGIRRMASQLTEAATKCGANSILVAGGYSQGAALTHRAVEDLPANVKARIAGIVTFGDTQNRQDNGQINNFPASKTKIICNPGK